MAVPSSGTLSLKSIANEKNQDDYNSDDEEVIDLGSISLRGLSNNSFTDFGTGASVTNIALNANSGSNAPNQTEPYSMSEFYGYDHDFDPVVHETWFTRGASGGYGFAQSGYGNFAPDIGDIQDSTLTLNGRGRTITHFYIHSSSASSTSGNLILKISDNAGTTGSNAGFTTLKVYYGQSNDSGSPDLTLNRTSASYSTSGGSGSFIMQWTWSISSSSPTVYNLFGANGTYNYLKFE